MMLHVTILALIGFCINLIVYGILKAFFKASKGVKILVTLLTAVILCLASMVIGRWEGFALFFVFVGMALFPIVYSLSGLVKKIQTN